LKHNPKLVGCGSFIKTAKSNFYYAQDTGSIESQLLKGHIIIEQGTLMYRNLGINAKNYYELLTELDIRGNLINIPDILVECDEYK